MDRVFLWILVLSSDDDAMDEHLLHDGSWLKVSHEYDPSIPTAALESYFHFPAALETSNYIGGHHSRETEESSNFKNPSNLICKQFMHDYVSTTNSEKQKEESILPSATCSETSRNTNLSPTTTSVRRRLVQAIEYLKEVTRNKDVLIQIWFPMKRGARHILTTNNQPFSLTPNCTSLAEYRHVSRNYQFAADYNSTEMVGLPGRVFLNKLPEWTPDVRFFKREEYPRLTHAQHYNVRGSLALPVFQRGSGTCLAVVEIVTTKPRLIYRPQLEYVCKVLEAVDLRSSNISSHPKVEDYCNNSYQAALAEIQNVVRCVCDTYKLPLAQIWAPCTQQGKGGCRHSDENYITCISTVDSACYVLDPQVQSFHEACSEHHLLKGEGVAGGAFLTNQPCFATDIKAFSKTEYPLSHQARMFGICAAVAIRLRSIYAGSADFVLEFFLPLDCIGADNQKGMLNSLSSMTQWLCQGLRVITDQELAKETASLTGEKCSSSIGKLDANTSSSANLLSSSLLSSLNDPARDASSWFTTMMKCQEKGQGVDVSIGALTEEPEEGFRMTPMWRDHEMVLLDMPTFPEKIHIQQDSGSKSKAEGSGELPYVGVLHSSGAKRAGEKRRTKAEKTISLEVLQQHFAGSLKDAARSIGVCPTTLKRICRQYGIQRWPSRKIKKVGHSLRKLQLVLDSVQGAEGAIQLSSFYTKFPDLSSLNSAEIHHHSMFKRSDAVLQSNMQPEDNLLSPGTTATKSPSSSCSHSSSSSLCCTMGAKQSPLPVKPSSHGDDLLAEQSGGRLKRARSDAELPLLGHKNSKLLRSHSQNILTEPGPIKALPPFRKRGSQGLPDMGIYRVKASFGEEKSRFSLQIHWGYADLKKELVRRFNIDDVGKVDIKYLDDDSEWVLLTCDDDLEECVDIHRSCGSHTIKLSLNQAYH